MRKLLAWILAVAMAMTLIGCTSPEPVQESTAAPAETTMPQIQSTQPAPTEPTVAETESAPEEYSLFLKVSSITFSVVGEEEDIYLGLAPRESVTWESEDPAIVSVENGVLTANGVGTTTVRARYGQQMVECTAGCLAQTQEELEQLPFDILSQPKRVIPEVDLEVPCTYFDNAAIVGDSITYMMMQCESKGNYLGDILFLARGGTSLNGFVRRFKNIYFQGHEMNLEDAIAASEVERAYILIGSNDLASDPQREVFWENWDTLLERIREKSPDVELVIISNIPQYADEQGSKGSVFLNYNRLVAEYNEEMKDYCRENGYLYFDLHYYIQDHCGRMPQEYNLDGYHLNETGYQNWMKILRYYAQYELEGGTF